MPARTATSDARKSTSSPRRWQAARARGIDARGPYPADTLFQPKYLEDADCVLAMYHDQGLPVLKHASFGRGVNITLGLPHRSAPRSTTAPRSTWPRAGLGRADIGSMVEAIRTAAPDGRCNHARIQ